MSNRPQAAGAIVFFILIALMQTTHAGYSMNPLVTMLDLSKNNTSGEVTIKYEKGDANIPLAIELKVKGRDVDITGATVSYRDNDAGDNFVIYPSQIVIMPGESQRVQIKWVGDAIPKVETAYGLIAEQAPVKLGDENATRTTAQGRVQVLVKYEGAIVVIPPGAKSRIEVDSAVAATDKEGKKRLVLSIRNVGSGRQKIAGLALRVSSLDKVGKIVPNSAITYKPELTSRQTKQSLFPGYARKLDLPWPPGLRAGPIKANVTFEDEP